jgi:hypothetical protein
MNAIWVTHMPVDGTMTILFLFHIAMLADSISIHFGKLKVMVRQSASARGLTCGTRSTMKPRKLTGSQRSGKTKHLVIKDRSENGRIRFTHAGKKSPELGITGDHAHASELRSDARDSTHLTVDWPCGIEAEK